MIEFFKQFPDVLGIVTLKDQGNMKTNGHNNRNVIRRKKDIFRGFGIYHHTVISASLVDGDSIAFVEETFHRSLSKTDGLITRKTIPMTITADDRHPVVMFDPENRIAGIFNAGWEGLKEEIISKAVSGMIAVGADPKAMHAYVGPGICFKHFEVDKVETSNGFKKKYADCIVKKEANGKRNGKAQVDLAKMIFLQLTAGKEKINPDNVEISGECTFCNPEKFFSSARDGKKGKGIEAMMVLFSMLKPNGAC